MHKIRKAKPEDLKKLAPIYVDAYTSIEIGENWTEETAYKLLKHLFETQPDLSFVLEVNGELVGAINAIVKPWWSGNQITDGELFIDPKHQRKGLGKKLVKHLFKEAKKKYKATSWDTFTHVIYEHPLKWYKNMGFEEIQEWVMITGDIDTVLKNLEDY